MNNKSHFWISFSKSLIRISGCVIVLFYVADLSNLRMALMWIGGSFGIAELLGIAEEIFDSRK